jgi:PhnB protein
MQSKLNPYINFTGNTKEAMEFYHSVFGGTLTMTTYKEGGISSAPENADKIMHAMLIADNGMTIMGSDAMEETTGTTISLSLSGDMSGELTSYYEKLSQGGSIMEPLKLAPWGDTFGMLTDKYGIRWMVNIAAVKGAK